METASTSNRTYVDGMETLKIKGDKVGRPRLDPYQRLLNRFYESLCLLSALGQTRGGHTPEPIARNEAEACRRRFMGYLAYLCDFDKGGISCTALAIEDAQSLYKFWVACNANESTAVKVDDFLRTVLETLSRIDSGRRNGETVREDETKLLHNCMRFSERRIAKDTTILKRGIKRCQSRLEEGPPEAGMHKNTCLCLNAISFSIC